jgi:hypothetical protein
MSRGNLKSYAALAVACLALALSIHTAVRGRSEPKATGAGACVDPDARAQLDQLRRALADRDALVARLARAAGGPGGDPTTGGPSRQAPAPPDPGPRRYAHFQIPNPAVSVTQKEDGTYEIRTTDPSLAGSVMQITAVTPSGEEDKLFIRIPE